MKDVDGKTILIGDLVEVPGRNGPMEVYGGNVQGTELWFFDHIEGRFDGVDPRLTRKLG